jgi:Lrp/AsnC family transcriptional regulator, regulator for asnA, asnC and gidA
VARKLDALEKELAVLLDEDGRLSLADAAARAGVSRPTAASRLKALLAGGALRVGGLVSAVDVDGLTIALIGLTLDKYRLDEKLEQIAGLDEVSWAAVVTGRYDIIVEVVTEDGMAGLYRFLTVSLQEVGGIGSSEMFVVMKARDKWVQLPAGMRRDWARGSQG